MIIYLPKREIKQTQHRGRQDSEIFFFKMQKIESVHLIKKMTNKPLQFHCKTLNKQCKCTVAYDKNKNISVLYPSVFFFFFFF